jgi:hypothetical protein
MSRDQHLDHAIDRHSRLADDTSYSIYTIRDDEGFAEHSWSDGVANNELRPRFTDVAWPTVTTTSTCASDNGSSSRRGPLNQLATANNKKISGSVQQSTSNVEFLDPSDIYSLNNQYADHWSGNALDPALLVISPNSSRRGIMIIMAITSLGNRMLLQNGLSYRHTTYISTHTAQARINMLPRLRLNSTYTCHTLG